MAISEVDQTPGYPLSLIRTINKHEPVAAQLRRNTFITLHTEISATAPQASRAEQEHRTPDKYNAMCTPQSMVTHQHQVEQEYLMHGTSRLEGNLAKIFSAELRDLSGNLGRSFSNAGPIRHNPIYEPQISPLSRSLAMDQGLPSLATRPQHLSGSTYQILGSYTHPGLWTGHLAAP